MKKSILILLFFMIIIMHFIPSFASDSENYAVDSNIYNERLKKAKELRESVGMHTENITSNENIDNRSVYITNSSAKFHSAGCNEIHSKFYCVSVDSAISRGYTPCEVCNPYGLAYETKEPEKINPIIYVICTALFMLVIFFVYNDNKNKKKV